MEKLKKYKGITLIALVVTILVLLIIAGVALNLALGENGLFNQTKLAVEKYKDAQNKEEEQLQIATNAMLGNVEVREGTVTIDGATLQGILDRLAALEQTSQGAMAVPVGTVISLMGNTAQSGYLICDGGEYEISDYQNLANYFEEQFGSKQYFGGTGTKFKLPDLRGEFLRGTGTAARDTGSGANVGEHQEPTQHLWLASEDLGRMKQSYWGYQPYSDKEINIKGDWKYSTQTGNVSDQNNLGYYTSRPTNTSVLYCIKY